MNPFHHVVNADVTLVIDVVRIIFLLAFLVFLKSSSSSNRSCRQKVRAHQSNSERRAQQLLEAPLPHACPLF